MVVPRLRRSAILGLSVGAESVRAILLERGVIQWAGHAAYQGLAELAEVLARLAGESGRPVRQVRVVLERAVIQSRSIVPAPPLKPAAARRYASLEAQRLFRKNGSHLVTDAAVLPIDRTGLALYAAAAPETLVQEILNGCKQAGLELDALGPAADVLPIVFSLNDGANELTVPNCKSSEVLSIGPAGTWRSRLIPSLPNASLGEQCRLPALAQLGPEAVHFAPAYAAAILAPRLNLLPDDARTARNRVDQRRRVRLALVGCTLWVFAIGVYVARLLMMLHASTKFLDAAAPSLDSALAQRRDLHAGQAALETMSFARQTRSRDLALVADLTTALGDSAFVVMLRVGPDGTLRLAGYGPTAAGVVADLERVRALRDVQLEGAVTRESPGGLSALDRFAIVGRVEGGR
jgi:hypothetical protein